jgi:signal transduction histidine kinase
MRRFDRLPLKLWLVGVWLLFVVSLTGWWFIFAFRQVHELGYLQAAAPSKIATHQKMLITEGAALIFALFAGGITLAYYVFRELRSNMRIRQFLANFSHEIKTALASVRLQAESLQEDNLSEESQGILKRLVSDTVNMELQLQNSISLARGSSQKLHLQDLELGEIVSSIQHHWPNLKISVNSEASFKGDQRVLKGILTNLVQNAFVHGKATEVRIETLQDEKRLKIRVTDNGRGFDASAEKLGTLFHQPTSTSGSGIGLYLCREWLKELKGSLEFPPCKEGFCAEVALPRSLHD